MVTGYKSVETAGEASKLGASGYIVKPFKSEDILETVKRILK
jgi:DNA-binding NtrC family response regulator